MTMKWQELPPIFFYPLLIPYVLKLCIQHRVTIPIISCSNPCFPYGGLPFASKTAMTDVFKDNMELKYTLIKTECLKTNLIAIFQSHINDF